MFDDVEDPAHRGVSDADSEASRPCTQANTELGIVGIGASAGGLESLERLFSRLPADTGMAFVILQHLSPDFKSLMDELLARRTSMPVRQAEHEMLLEPDSVYLLPPMKEMIVRDRRLLLSDRDPRHGLALPIDHFFRSLAQEAGEQAVGVILSGSGSDGSRGVQEIRRAGGTVLCESPESAKFTGMPLSAIATGVVDQVLPPEEIAAAIAAIARPAAPAWPEQADEADDEGVGAILRLLRDEYQIDFSHYKVSTVTRRIERRLALNRTLDLEGYVEQLRRDPRELNSLYEDLLIGVTRFFRDEEAFTALERDVIPVILDRAAQQGSEQVRVWVAGCATGQEAYSVAILLHEQLAARRRPVDLKILATDVHRASLEIASAGVYSEPQLAGLSSERIERFFTRKPNGFQIAQALRESIVFAPHNLLRDSPFTKLDLIACRNLLIYFQPHAQDTVLTLFHFALKTGGFLLLGSSETPRAMLDEFDAIDSHAKIFRKRRDIGLPADLKLPLPRAAAATPPAPVRGSAVSPQLLAVYDRLLDRCMPPSFLVDGQGLLVDSYGGSESLLKVKPRRPTSMLPDMLTGELRAVVSGALHRIRKERDVVRYEGIPLPGHAERVTVVAEPLRDPNGAIGHILFSFGSQEATRRAVPRPAEGAVAADEPVAPHAAVDLTGLTESQMRALEDELSYTKENLQAAIQELETTNEELQATNEELVASNEELQSTNEELHSVNEELYTVNAEYQKKNAELLELNDDIEHLLNGTDVATLFLDRDLRIRKFTPRIAEIFQVIPHDVGRPLATFTHDLVHPDLMADIERVLREGTTVEAQTWDRRGRCYFLRILPYRGRHRHGTDRPGQAPPVTDRPAGHDGVVVTLTDISALEQARARVAQLSAIVESSDDAIISSTLDGVITSWNKGATRLYGYTPETAIGRHLNMLSPPADAASVAAILKEVGGGRPVEHIETVRVRQDGTFVDVSVTYSPILGGADAVVGVSAIARDITALVRARRELAEREERIRLLLDSTAEAIYGIDLSGVCTFCNAACARVLGYDSPAALIGRQMHPLIHHTRKDGTPYPPEQSPIYESMRHRGQAHVDGEVLWRADGTSFPAEYWSHPIVRDGEVIGAVVTFLDITERRRAEEEIQEGVRRREQFLAMLSHELRNPLAAVLSATQVLDQATWDDRACEEAARVVNRQAKHMTRLLDDLLDVSRITRGRIVLRKELVDLRDPAQSAIESMRPLLAEHDTRLEVDMSAEPLPVEGDPARLQQICANLLSNASKYSPRGAPVRFDLHREDGQAVLRVIDRGRGIEPDLLPRIFDLFVQGDQPIARSEGGLGIGLTLLRSLVELHQGRVHAVSDGAGRGSTFTVWLPLALAVSESLAAPCKGAGHPIRRIVLVEDQPDALRMLQLLLENGEREVFTATNGLEGVQLIERVRPDLAIVDLGLPVMSGYDLARRVRQDPAHDWMRLVALSGYGQDADIQAALDAGFDEHLTKPTDPERLEQVLDGRVTPRARRTASR